MRLSLWNQDFIRAELQSWNAPSNCDLTICLNCHLTKEQTCEWKQLCWEFGFINIHLHFIVFTKIGNRDFRACVECLGAFESRWAYTCGRDWSRFEKLDFVQFCQFVFQKFGFGQIKYLNIRILYLKVCYSVSCSDLQGKNLSLWKVISSFAFPLSRFNFRWCCIRSTRSHYLVYCSLNWRYRTAKNTLPVLSHLWLNSKSVDQVAAVKKIETLVKYFPDKQYFFMLALSNREVQCLWSQYMTRNYDMSSKLCYLTSQQLYFNKLCCSTHDPWQDYAQNMPKRGISSLPAVHGGTADKGNVNIN